MKNIFSNCRIALTGLALLLQAATGSAGSIELTPVRINLSGGTPVAVVTVRNTGPESSVMQVTLNKWALAGQRYAYEQSQELVVTPVTFLLAPGSEQIVRIGLRGTPPVAREDSYRLLIEEVPPPASQHLTETRLVVRHDLPVFVAPALVARPALDFDVECAADGTRLRLTNTGNVHAQLQGITLATRADKTVLGRWETFDYLLPEAQRSYRLSDVAPATMSKQFHVSALTDQGSFTDDVKDLCP